MEFDHFTQNVSTTLRTDGIMVAMTASVIKVAVTFYEVFLHVAVSFSKVK